MLVNNLAHRVKQLIATRIFTPSCPKNISPLAAQANGVRGTYKMLAPAAVRNGPAHAAKSSVPVPPKVTPNSAQFLAELNATVAALAQRRQAAAQIAAPVFGPGGIARPDGAAAKPCVVPMRKKALDEACARVVPLRAAPMPPAPKRQAPKRPAPMPPAVAGTVDVALTQDTKLWPAANLHQFAREIGHINRRMRPPSGEQLVLQVNLVTSSKNQLQRAR